MIGSVLSNRYKIIEKVGEGGMALVYKAKDTLLGRTVAVKVLRPQYASDEEFVERFRREAQSAASLSHPNVVNIYDVGQDESVYFIVMEYINGENLKDIIKARAPMPVTEVIAIARQMAEALDHAHRNDIVHRDIKPHNILVTKEGRVKVTDFGIARAASLSSLTQTGMVVGSVHYFSPEQAKGGVIGVQSDLYSVGVVIYEMVTGTVPFKGDTPISVALAHIQDEAPPVRSLNPNVPPALEKVITLALRKDLDKRYKSAEDMLRDLYIASAQAYEMEATDQGTTRVMAIPKTQIDDMGVDEPTLIRGRENGMANNESKKKRKWLWPVMLSSILLVTIILSAILIPKLLFDVAEVKVPDLIGLSVSDAETTADELGLMVEKTEEQYDSRIASDHIVSQQPPAGRVVKKGRKIMVVISKGPEKVIVPDLVGQSIREAETSILEADLTVGLKNEGYNSTIPAGQISSQSPRPDSEVDKGTAVDLVISKGPQPSKILVPNFIGLKINEATGILGQVGLSKGKVVYEQSETVEKDLILEQYPEAESEVVKGQAVNFVVSRGNEMAASDTASGETRRFEVKATVPEGPSEQEVKIVITDALGTRTVYRKIHRTGDTVSQVVEAHGPGKIQVYLAGELVQEENI